MIKVLFMINLRW